MSNAEEISERIMDLIVNRIPGATLLRPGYAAGSTEGTGFDIYTDPKTPVVQVRLTVA